MNLDEYLTHLSYTTLSNLALGMDGTGSIRVDKIPMVVSHINSGLLRLYTRFMLLERDVIIDLIEDRTKYVIDARHNINGGDPECALYIRDQACGPFANDLVKIMEVYSSEGCRLPLNNGNECNSVYTPAYNQLEVPFRVHTGQALALTYQAKHPVLDYSVSTTAPLLVPDTLLEALSAYVAHLIHSNINTDVSVANAEKYLMQYESICNEVELRDAANSSYSETGSKFQRNGWI